MSNRLGGKQGTAYTGTNANQPPNWTFSDRPPTIYDSQNVVKGDLWLDSSATGIDRVWVLVSLDGNAMSKGVLAEWKQFAGGGTVAESFPTDSGTAIPAAHVLNINAANSLLNCGSTVKFTGSGNTVQLNVSDLSLSNTIIGGVSGNLTISGGTNTGLGINVLAALSSGSSNCAYGVASAQAMTTGSENLLAGISSGARMTSSSNNVGLGSGSLVQLLTGSENLALGYLSGGALVGAESNNVLIKNLGVAAESNTIRIGTQGSGAGQQNRAFMAGVRGVTTGVADAINVVIDSAGQLGTAIAPVVTAKSIIATSGAAVVSFNGATAYAAPFGIFIASDPTEQLVSPAAATISFMYVNVTANASTVDTTVTLYKNGAPTALVATVTALTTGVFSDITHSVSIAAADLIQFFSSSAATGTVTGNVSALFIA